MVEERSFPCPNCEHKLWVNVHVLEGVLACPRCNERVSIPPRGPEALDPQGITASPQLLRAAPEDDDEPSLPDIRLQPKSIGERLAVPALLLPLFTAALIYAGRLEGEAAALVLTCGTVIITAVLLAVDAWYLGEVDAKGQNRGSGAPLFFGLLTPLWIVFFPMAFFRRRHFGRPNLGPASIFIALVFAASLTAAFVDPWRDDMPPACDSPEVKRMVEELVRQDPLGGQIQSVNRFREIRVNEEAKTRQGRCAVDTGNQNVTVGFEVSWADARRRKVHIRLLTANEDPRGFLGIMMQKAARQGPAAREGGVLVTNVVAEHAAAKAGLKPGDVIVRVNNRSFTGANPMAQMQEYVIDLEPGVDATLEVMRGGERLHVPIKIGQRPEGVP